MFKSINGGLLPQRATKYSAGFDVFANEDVTIGAGETVLVGLGIALDGEILSIGDNDWFCANDGDEMKDSTAFMATEYYLELHPRSSLRAKGLGGGVGIIDMDFIPKCKIGKSLNNGYCEHFKQKLKA